MRLLQDLVGPGKARELLFTCDYIDGREAERINLVNKAVPDDRLMDEALAMARKIAGNSLFSIGLIKKGLVMANETSLEALMDYEVEACLASVSTKEREAQLEAFQERKQKGD
jgi:enoyl-CoA hydratase